MNETETRKKTDKELEGIDEFSILKIKDKKIKALVELETENSRYFDSIKLSDDFLKNIKIKEFGGNKFASLSISDKADQYDEDDEKHSPIFAYLVLNSEELRNIPFCEVFRLRGNLYGISLETLKSDGRTDWERRLEPIFYQLLTEGFVVEMGDLDFIVNRIAGQFDVVALTISHKYIIFSEHNKEPLFSYIIGNKLTKKQKREKELNKHD